MHTTPPPHNPEAELDVLAACLASETALAGAHALGLLAKDFYVGLHGDLYVLMSSISAKGSPVDLVTILQAAGNTSELYGLAIDLMGRFAIQAHADYKVGLVIDAARRRAAIVACYESMVDLRDPSAEDPVSDSVARLMAVNTERSREAVHDFGDVAQERLATIYAAAMGERRTASVETGLYDLDRMARIEAGEMIVLGARPSAGKTAIGVQVLTHVARSLPVLFFSLEMSREAIAGRYFTGETATSAHRQQSGYLQEHEIAGVATAAERAKTLRFRIDDRVGLTVAQIAATARREHIRSGGLGLVVIDHLVKVKAADAKATGHARLTQISNDLKNLARQLQVPFLVLAQLNRDSDKQERKPRASDLRESGSIEEDADHIWLLHRPERDKGFCGAELLVEKQRNGPCGVVHLTFDAARTRFECQERMGVL